MHFYELHEGDGEVYSDLLLFRDDEMDAERFFELVQDIRRRIQDSFDHETLIEAIAEELERDHDFVYISDDRLSAAVNVSRDDDDNFLADLTEPIEEDGDYRSIRAEMDADARRN